MKNMFIPKRQKKLLLYSTQISGGCYIYATELIKRLNKNSEVVLPKIVCENIKTQSDYTIKFYGYNKFEKISSFICSSIRLIFNALCGKYTGLILFGITKWDYWFSFLWKFTRLPLLVVIHDGIMHEGDYNPKFQLQIHRFINNSDIVITLSDYVKNIIKNEFNFKGDIKVVPHGLIDYGSKLLIEKDKTKTLPQILYFGRVSKYKGIDVLLQAMEIVPSNLYSKLVIAGKWDIEKNDILKNKQNKVDIIDKYLSDDEIVQLVTESDIMVFPYKEATQSGVATIAINYLKPSVVTNVGAFKEQFGEKGACFVDCDSTSIANGIIYLLEDVDNRKILINKLNNRKQELQWDTIADNFEKYLIQKLY